jgi:hypothetical protein
VNVFRGDAAGDVDRRLEAESQAMAKVALVAGFFERLMADAGLRGERVAQLLAEMCEERGETPGAAAVERRAA